MKEPEFGLGAIACHLVFLIGPFILLNIKSDKVYSYVILPGECIKRGGKQTTFWGGV